MTKGFVWLMVGALFVFSAGKAGADEAKLLGEKPLVSFHLVPEAPKVGEPVVVYLQLELGFERNLADLEVTLSGVRKEATKTGSSLWVLSLPAFTEIQSNALQANVYIRNKRDAENNLEARRKVDLEILDLKQKIANEADESKRAILEAALDQREALKERLEEEYDNLKVFIKSEISVIDVLPNPTNENFPVLQSVSPNLGISSGGKIVTLTGLRFESSPTVKIGGVNASIIFSSATEIQAVTPALSNSIKDVEVKFPGSETNSILKNAYFSTKKTILVNLRPVASVTGYQTASRNDTVILDGLASYDPNPGTNFSYEWRVIAAPKNSSLVPGTMLPSVAAPSFVADKKGVFSIEFKIREIGTLEGLVSLPVVATVEVDK